MQWKLVEEWTENASSACGPSFETPSVAVADAKSKIADVENPTIRFLEWMQLRQLTRQRNFEKEKQHWALESPRRPFLLPKLQHR